MQPIVQRRKIQIEELDDCWMVNPPGGLHDSAIVALAWVKNQDDAAAKAGISRITTIEWITKTRTGRSIVKVISNP